MAVDFAKDGGIGLITLDRPPANSYEITFIGELNEAVDAAARDDDVKAVVVRSAPEKFFSAGADIKAFSASSPDDNMRMVRSAHAVLSAMGAAPKVFIAEIAAHALGGGLEIALACDLRFGSDGSYQLGLPESRLGLLPGNGGTQRLSRLIGASRALDLMVTGRPVGPREALELGILDRVFPAEELEDKTREYCEQLAAGASLAIGNIKRAVNEGLRRSLESGLALEIDLLDELFRSSDANEGIAAFTEKRKPAFTGR
ncbi:MAG: enoyl-CoA hydratase-related protein [Actinomycetia bacterium]|nr:enoyl-CoA hydratase-related protein [Actinomycetes bacterium]